MKRKGLVYVWIVVAAMMCPALFVSCIDYASQGTKAAAEFCDCLSEGYSKDECEKQFLKNYDRAEYMNNDFISAFNKEGEDCGITATKYAY